MKGLVAGLPDTLYCVTDNEQRSWRTADLYTVLYKFRRFGWSEEIQKGDTFFRQLTQLVLPLEFM